VVRDFEDSTLWRVSAFERETLASGNTSGFARLGSQTVLPTTVLSDLRRLSADPATNDVLEAMAAFQRHREAALLILQHEQLVWPVTLFPQHRLYHSPRDLVADSTRGGLATLRLLSAEPPGVRPPGHWMHERIAHAEHYRPLAPLLRQVALYGPRRTLLAEIGGRAAYRLMPDRESEPLSVGGALAPAVQRLRREAVSLREMAQWPGLSVERASRLLNALYLTGSLLVTRSHAAARDEPGRVRRLFGGRR
jgi:hypothetical protein